MITRIENTFVLHTKHTTYCFGVLPTGQLEHYHYGRKITVKNAEALMEKHEFQPGNTIAYDNEHMQFSLEDMCLEMSSYGKGDIREPFVELVHADGNRTCDFIFEKAEIAEGKPEYETLPGSYDENNQVEHLTITLREKVYDTVLELHYYVYENCDVITRSAKLINDGTQPIRVDRLLSAQLDFRDKDYVITSFNGAWAREMKRTDVKLSAGKHVNASCAGVTSSRANAFVMMSRENTDEDHGDCYGMNLIYSGNHYEAFEVNSFGKTRFVSGINPQTFEFILDPMESLEAPEAVMTYSRDGYNGMSQQMHAFVNQHIVRGEWKHKERPILLNSWEAAYFNINEKKLLGLAKAAKEVGIELFVMDDGWFGTRDDDKQSLGDWRENTKKLPNGVAGLAKKVNDLGLDFGIWVEPEMVNVNSECYRNHPDWAVDVPGCEHSEGRNQRVLDLTNEEVQEYIISEMSNLFSSANIAYVKWDMNRIFSDYFSKKLDVAHQGEFAHRYVIGLYRTMKELTARFPHILFEGCCAGGNRFDLGILSYFPQIWASDDTDASCRAEIQNGYSYGYPLSTISAHVSACPNHQTLRRTPLETRFDVACFGVCGYECNLSDSDKEELAAIKEQVEIYKYWRSVFQFGQFYRSRSGYIYEWTVVSEDKKRAVGMLMQNMVTPNSMDEVFRAKGLEEEQEYHFYNRFQKHNVKGFGDLINTAAPIHIKPDSFAHHIVSKFVKMDGESEDYSVYGDALMYSGVKLKQAFAATGYNNQVRYFQDYASRLYFMEAMED